MGRSSNKSLSGLRVLFKRHWRLLFVTGVVFLFVGATWAGQAGPTARVGAAPATEGQCTAIGGRWIPTGPGNYGPAYCGDEAGCEAQGKIWNPVVGGCVTVSANSLPRSQFTQPPTTESACTAQGGRWIPTGPGNYGAAYCFGQPICEGQGGTWANNACTTTSTATLEEQITRQMYYDAITTCYAGDFRHKIYASAGDDGLSTRPLDPLEGNAPWFYNQDRKTFAGIPETGCNAITEAGLSRYFGYGTNYYRFLQDVGYSWQRDDPPDNDNGVWRWEASGHDAVRDQVDDVLTSKGPRIGTDTAVGRYWQAYLSFMSGCTGAEVDPWHLGDDPYHGRPFDSLSDSEKSIVTTGVSNRVYRIANIVTDTGLVATVFRMEPNTSSASWHNCDDLVTAMNDNAPAYLQAVLNEACLAINKYFTTSELAACRAGLQNPSVDGYCANAFADDIAAQGACEDGRSGQLLSNIGDRVETDPVDTDTTTCAISGIGWIVCPVMTFLGTVGDQLFNFLAGSFLRTDVSLVAADDGNAVYSAWGMMRSIANVAFVIAFLVIIFSQMTGAGIGSYGIKKMLPRLVIAAILVNVSFFVVSIAVDVSNILGYSIKDLFDGIGRWAMPDDVGQAGNQGWGWALLITGLLAGGITLAFAISVPVLLAAVLAVLMVALTLAARTALIVLLIIISPLAFVAYLLPNTEQWFKKWLKMFSSLLLLFPIVAVVFGASSLAAQVIQVTGANNGDTLMQVVAIAISALPLFVVPSMLKGALNAAGSVGAKIQGWNTKAQGRVGREAKKTFGNSSLGTMNKLRGQNAARRRSIRQGRIGEAFGRLPGQSRIGRQMAATGLSAASKIKNEDIDLQAALLKERTNPNETIGKAQEQLEAAARKGDVIAARAAIRVLKGSGGPGVDALAESVDRVEGAAGYSWKSAFGQGIRTELAASGLKGTHAGLDTLAFDRQDRGLRAIMNDPATFAGLNDTERAGQRPRVLFAAARGGQMTREHATAIRGNPNVFKDLSPTVKQLIADVSNGTAITDASLKDYERRITGSAPTTAAATASAPIQVVPTANDEGVLDLHPERGGNQPPAAAPPVTPIDLPPLGNNPLNSPTSSASPTDLPDWFGNGDDHNDTTPPTGSA